MLAWLLLLPVLVVMYVQIQQRRRRMTAGFGDPVLMRETPGTRTGVRRHIPAILFLVALGILIVALARPQAEVGLPRLEGTVILVFDVSGSMAADDLKPTRMEAAKAAALDFVANQPPTVRVGVVSFSDGGFTTQPPTDDQASVAAAINRLAVQSGTSVGRGIEAALNVIAADAGEGPLTLAVTRTDVPAPTATPVPDGAYKSAVIVLLTDGENNQDPDPLELAQRAEDRGIRIYTVGIGTTEGAILNIEGFSIRSRLDEEGLQQIAQLTGGEYFNATSEEDLRAIYNNLNPQLMIRPQEMEVTSLFVGAGILVLVIAGALSLVWLGRLP
jgi:Ca-activated chloride channel family protein